jgi:threonine synthase
MQPEPPRPRRARPAGAWRGIVQEFREDLSLPAGAPAVSLCEGNTPLVAAVRAGRGADLFFKVEGCNPTGSFKDRGMAVAVSGAVALGARALVCASTGNTSASAAAYAARAGLPALLAVPAGDGAVAKGKLAQALAAGARLVLVRGNFDQALAAVRALAAAHPQISLVNSVNPLRLEGQKTGAFEVVDQLGDAPDWLCIPVGNAGNVSAYWRGFCEDRQARRSTTVPRLLGVQAAGAAPLVTGRPVDEPRTLASAIRIGRPASAHLARAAVAEADGRFLAVSDEQIVDAYRFLAREEGIFCEPASAAALAGFWAARASGLVPEGARVVCVLTGHGLKDPDRAVAEGDAPLEVEATAEALASVLPPGVA